MASISTIDRSISKQLLCLLLEQLLQRTNRNILPSNHWTYTSYNGQRRTNKISNPWTWRDHLTIDTRTNALIHVGNPENLPDDVTVSDLQTYVAIKPASLSPVLHQLDQDAWNNDTGGSSTSLMYHHVLLVMDKLCKDADIA